LEHSLACLIQSKLRQAADGEGNDLPGADPRTLLEWTQQSRVIQNRKTREYSPFSLAEYPWLRPLYNEIGAALLEARAGTRYAPLFVLRKAAQMGATEFALNAAFYGIDEFGLNVFYALPPGAGIAGDFAHTRVDPAIAHSPHLREIAGDTDNVGLKTFRRGALYLRGTHIPAGRPDKAAQLAQVPADIAVIDEWDRIPPAAIPLIYDRLGDSRFKIKLGLSTPTYPGVGIDAEYQASDQREPAIRCQACGEESPLNWDLVGERDGQVEVWCPQAGCGAAIDLHSAWDHKPNESEARLRFVAQNPESQIVGFWIPKLVSPRANLAAMWQRAQSTQEADRLAFWNNDMGLPYEPKGARLNLELLRACMGGHLLSDTVTSGWAAMGVDVGRSLHVWVMEPLPDGLRRTVFVGEVGQWEDLDRLMARYGVGACVVDDGPELVADVAFARRHRGKVFLATYVEELAGAEWCQFDLKRQRVRIERTAGLDRSHGNIEGQRDVLPADFEAVEGLVEHMTANLKARGVKPDGTVFYHFPRTGRPDHYDHAKVYAEAAFERLGKLRRPEETPRASSVPTTSKARSYRGRL